MTPTKLQYLLFFQSDYLHSRKLYTYNIGVGYIN